LFFLIKHRFHCVGRSLQHLSSLESADVQMKQKSTVIEKVYDGISLEKCVLPHLITQSSGEGGEATGSANTTPKVLIWWKSGQNPSKSHENLAKICENFRKILKNLGKLSENTIKNGAQLALIWQKWRPMFFDLKKWRPKSQVIRNRKYSHKTWPKFFRASLGKYWRKSFAPPFACSYTYATQHQINECITDRIWYNCKQMKLILKLWSGHLALFCCQIFSVEMTMKNWNFLVFVFSQNAWSLVWFPSCLKHHRNSQTRTHPIKSWCSSNEESTLNISSPVVCLTSGRHKRVCST